MKIIQTQNPESTGHFHKYVILICILLVVILLVVMFFVSCSENKYSAKIYSDENEILSIFHDNINEFNQIAKILHQNEYFYDRYEKHGDRTMFSPYTFKWELYFSKEQYEKLEHFFLDFYPWYIGDYEYTQINFYANAVNVSLFYINIADNNYDDCVDAEDRQERILRYLSKMGEVIPLGENWYYRTTPADVVRK